MQLVATFQPRLYLAAKAVNVPVTNISLQLGTDVVLTYAAGQPLPTTALHAGNRQFHTIETVGGVRGAPFARYIPS